MICQRLKCVVCIECMDTVDIVSEALKFLRPDACSQNCPIYFLNELAVGCCNTAFNSVVMRLGNLF